LTSTGSRENLAKSLGDQSALDEAKGRGLCRFASRAVKQTGFLPEAVGADELADHSLAQQINARKEGAGGTVFGYTFRTMDPLYSDPCFSEICVRDHNGRPLFAVIGLTLQEEPPYASLVAMDPADSDVVSAMQYWVRGFAIFHNVELQFHRHVTHEAGMRERYRWFYPGCPHGVCHECRLRS